MRRDLAGRVVKANWATTLDAIRSIVDEYLTGEFEVRLRRSAYEVVIDHGSGGWEFDAEVFEAPQEEDYNVSTDRDRATIEALKIALQQACDVLAVRDWSQLVVADIARWRAMAAPDWSALPGDDFHACSQCGWSGTGFHACEGVPGGFGEDG